MLCVSNILFCYNELNVVNISHYCEWYAVKGGNASVTNYQLLNTVNQEPSFKKKTHNLKDSFGTKFIWKIQLYLIHSLCDTADWMGIFCIKCIQKTLCIHTGCTYVVIILLSFPAVCQCHLIVFMLCRALSCYEPWSCLMLHFLGLLFQISFLHNLFSLRPS